MKNKVLVLMLAITTAFAFQAPSSYAIGAKEAGASLILPSTGQAMNGELGTTKSKIMVGVEVAAIATIAILGTAVGGGVVWAGIGPLIANHAWSSVDAYKSANRKYQDAGFQQSQLSNAQNTLESSRQRRFEREQTMRSSIRERVARAGEQAYYAG